eukprot:Gb_24086 [translate_table: standard]
MMKIILCTLGMEMCERYSNEFENCEASVNMNHYSPNHNDSEGEEVSLLAHSDTSCFTILYQDEVGGLQVRESGGEWLGVEPLADSLVFNIGYSLQVTFLV